MSQNNNCNHAQTLINHQGFGRIFLLIKFLPCQNGFDHAVGDDASVTLGVIFNIIENLAYS